MPSPHAKNRPSNARALLCAMLVASFVAPPAFACAQATDSPAVDVPAAPPVIALEDEDSSREARRAARRRRRAPVVALLPFGAGQFRNGDRRLARWIAITEGLSLAVNLVGVAWWRSLAHQSVRIGEVDRYTRRLHGALALNWIGGLAFFSIAFGGAAEAEIRLAERRASPSAVVAAPARVSISPTGAELVWSF